MRYAATIKRTDGSESTYTSMIDTTQGDTAAVELAKNTAESYGHELVSLKDADGKEIPMDDQKKDTNERIDEQNKTTTERVEEQNKTETKEVSPNKTGDVKPNR